MTFGMFALFFNKGYVEDTITESSCYAEQFIEPCSAIKFE
jgi:hypothetical protein